MSVMQKVEGLRVQFFKPLRLDLPARADDPDGESRGDLLAADTPSQADLLERSEQVSTVREAIGRLDMRERFVILHRHGFAGDMTLREIGEKLGLSRERIRQIESQALERLRGHLQGAGVRS